MNLGVTRVSEISTLAVGPPGGGDIASHRIGRQEEDVAVPTGGQHHRIRHPRLDSTGDHVASHDPTCLAVHDDQFDHLVAGIHLHGAGLDLTLQRLIGPDQQLLTSLATGVEGTLHLDTTERPGIQQSTIFARERDPLRHALVDDVRADLGQAVHIGLAGPVITALDRVVEQSLHRVVVVAVVLGGIDATLGRDRVGPTRTVLVAEVQNVVASLAEGCRSRTAGQPGTDHDHRQLATVSRIDQFGLELAGAPLLLDRPIGGLRVGDLVTRLVESQRRVCSPVFHGPGRHHFTNPTRTDTGMIMKPK